jgi:hypothetical protein
VAFLDLKTTQKNDPKSWGETITERQYDLQAALYRAVWRCNYEGEPESFWVTVSDDQSPVVAVYYTEPFISEGHEKLRRALQLYKDLMQNGERPLTAIKPWWAKKGEAA